MSLSIRAAAAEDDANPGHNMPYGVDVNQREGIR